ncbi:MAG TPA: hypothetical protein VL551_05670 [Actinospica sp.]|jgi:hypothetical protein|nr:hypothetical protein [Actinospica sp.]
MIRTGRLAAAGLAAATLALAGGSVAEAASTGGLGTVSVQPNPAAPGSTVWVWDGDQCAGTSGTATSAAFTAPASLGQLDNMLGGSTMVAKVKPGTYKVTVSCSGKSFTGWVVVAPRGAARTGDGASMLSSGGGNLAAGAALGAAGLGVGAFALRRRRAHNN